MLLFFIPDENLMIFDSLTSVQRRFSGGAKVPNSCSEYVKQILESYRSLSLFYLTMSTLTYKIHFPLQYIPYFMDSQWVQGIIEH